MVRLLLAVLGTLYCCASFADVPSIPAPPKVAVSSHYLMDYATGAELAGSEADEQLPPASLTKLMTAYVVFKSLVDGRIRLDDQVRVSEKAWRTGGTRMFIEVNSLVEVEDLIRGMLIQSGNDASVALAEHIAGSVEEFVILMNQEAARLGMHNSVWRNPTGLPARGHVSSARDLAILARAIIAEFPEYYTLYSEREFTYNGITQYNRNVLLRRDSGVDGLKTGYTAAAGYCLVSAAVRDGMRLIAVVLGAKSPKARADGAQALLDYGFDNFETHKLYGAGDELSVARVRGGQPEVAPLGLAKDLYVTIPRGQYDALAAELNVTAPLVAPLERGTPVGEVQVSLAGEPVSRLPLVALQSVVEGGAWTKFVGELTLWLE